jgi:hypothetical protein
MKFGKCGLAAALALCLGMGASAYGTVFINEFHYDNTGTDAGEFIEVVLDGGTAAADVDIFLYNGSDNMLYTDAGTVGTDIFNVATHFTFHGTLGDGKDYYSLSLPVNGLQNGAPDAIASAISGGLVEFLSYEGTMTGSGSVANGVLSTDIGVIQDSSTLLGSSLQRIAFGSTWVATDGSNTQGAVNVPEPATMALLAIGAVVALRRRS